MHTYVCVSGGKKCLFFRKFDVLCFLETPVLRFALPSCLKNSCFYDLVFISSVIIPIPDSPVDFTISDNNTDGLVAFSFLILQIDSLTIAILTYLSKLMLDFPPRRKPSKVQTKQTAMKETKGKIKGVLGDYAMPQIETTVSIKSFHDLFILQSGCWVINWVFIIFI